MVDLRPDGRGELGDRGVVPCLREEIVQRQDADRFGTVQDRQPPDAVLGESPCRHRAVGRRRHADNARGHHGVDACVGARGPGTSRTRGSDARPRQAGGQSISVMSPMSISTSTSHQDANRRAGSSPRVSWSMRAYRPSPLGVTVSSTRYLLLVSHLMHPGSPRGSHRAVRRMVLVRPTLVPRADAVRRRPTQARTGRRGGRPRGEGTEPVGRQSGPRSCCSDHAPGTSGRRGAPVPRPILRDMKHSRIRVHLPSPPAGKRNGAMPPRGERVRPAARRAAPTGGR
jgi:hypothetical protein